MEFTTDYGLEQMITGNTRFMENHAPSRLDHVWTSMPGDVDRIFSKMVVDSDHKLVSIRLMHLHVVKTKKITFRNWSKLDPAAFGRLWRLYSPHEVYACYEVNNAVEVLNMKINAILDYVVPVRTIFVGGRNSPWLNSSLRETGDIMKPSRRMMLRSGYPTGPSDPRLAPNSVKPNSTSTELT